MPNSDITQSTHVAIIGAGPYGLSLAAHLRSRGVPHRIFGRAMQSWATQMPAGMKLKSDGFASNLYTGDASFTLEDFCRETGRAYHPTDVPVAVEDFVAYGEEFARRFVPGLDTRDVTNVVREGDGFLVTAGFGDQSATFRSQHVVVATGLSLFQHVPAELAHLPPGAVTHTTDHRIFDSFAGRDVTVLGRGASSLNAAALLHEAGARVTLFTRAQKVVVHSWSPATHRSLYQRLRHPASPLGSSLRSWLSCTAPGVFRALPYALRRALTYKHLGPSGGAALDGRVHGHFPIHTGTHITSAEMLSAQGSAPAQLQLTYRDAAGILHESTTSHIIVGTGFQYDLTRLSFLAPALLKSVRRQPTGAPHLNRWFESSVPGLSFIGPAASTSFGQLLRFAAGAGFAADRVTQRVERTWARAARADERESQGQATPHTSPAPR